MMTAQNFQRVAERRMNHEYRQRVAREQLLAALMEEDDNAYFAAWERLRDNHTESRENCE